ncbi:hypothetical protein FOZ62_022818 [Perkinsus olseni]|uniref:Uncharacterized protein n=2 Tax=Perkinsus olseni TaxID=32597 RepID=A0A7J6TIG1_PEROL|nr:hypothetical protein FOZ62_022818 [Perkinsus olseni]
MTSVESGLATFLYATVHGKKREVSPPGIAVYICQDSSGTIVCAENKRTDCSFVIELDASESKNVVSSRGSMTTQDTIPPMTRAVLMTLSPEKNATKFQLSLAMAHGVQPGDGGGGIFFPPPADVTMHVFLPIAHRPQQIVSSSTSSSSAAAESSAQPPSTQQRIKTLFDEFARGIDSALKLLGLRPGAQEDDLCGVVSRNQIRCIGHDSQ